MDATESRPRALAPEQRRRFDVPQLGDLCGIVIGRWRGAKLDGLVSAQVPQPEPADFVDVEDETAGGIDG